MRNLSLSSTRILISSFVGPTKKIVRNKTLELENVSFFLSFFPTFERINFSPCEIHGICFSREN